jgi:hypothetical protein
VPRRSCATVHPAVGSQAATFPDVTIFRGFVGGRVRAAALLGARLLGVALSGFEPAAETRVLLLAHADFRASVVSRVIAGETQRTQWCYAHFHGCVLGK